MTTKKCKMCGSWFEKKATTSIKRWALQEYCSPKCHYDIGRKKIECKNCGKIFDRRNCEGVRKFCCKKCRIEYRKSHDEEYMGFKKGHKWHGSKPWLGKKFSEQHKNNISKANKGNPNLIKANIKTAINHQGENHWNWKGGVTEELQKIRHSKEYDNWRFAVYARDKFCCRECEKKCNAKEIVAHHIKSFKDFPKLRFEVKNGVTLCRSCHKIEHEEIGSKTRFKTEVMV